MFLSYCLLLYFDRWERLGDIVVLPVTSFKDDMWNSIGEELWPLVARALGAQRLARQVRCITLLMFHRIFMILPFEISVSFLFRLTKRKSNIGRRLPLSASMARCLNAAI